MTCVLIILEGPDCAGKSTLAELILRYLFVKYPRDTVELIHRGPPTGHPLDEYVVPLIDYRPNTRHHIVCDRWHLGEWVYPIATGRKTYMDISTLNYVEMFLASRGALTAILNPGVDAVMTRYRERGDALQSDTVIRAAVTEYFTEIPQRHALSFSTATADDVVFVAREAEWSARLLTAQTYVGTPSPQTLLVGDVRGCGGGDECKHSCHHPAAGSAFMPYPGTSGHYLMKSLGGDPADVALVNACDVDDVWQVWQDAYRPHVVALGVRAHKQLDKVKIPHATVPHPQFVRRFHHAADAGYGRLIYDVAGTERNELKWRP